MPADILITIGESDIGPAIDHRGDGGYVVAPPSVHPDTGRQYKFAKGRRFKDIALQSGVGINTLLARKRYAVMYLRRRLQTVYDELDL